MPQMTLHVGSKNYSSWSLRPWLVMKHFAIPFVENKIPFVMSSRRREFTEETKRKLRQVSPTGRVPCLHHGALVLPESTVICEYLQDVNPDLRILPRAPARRAIARSICAEIHSGFFQVRLRMPMCCDRKISGKAAIPEIVGVELARIFEIWGECLGRGGGGTFLFGDFTMVDAMFAPLALRLRTYAVTIPKGLENYLERLLSPPPIREWVAEAGRERERIRAIDRMIDRFPDVSGIELGL